MELLQPWGALALLAWLAILALYMLKKEAPPRTVGSLMLWQAAQEKVYRGKPWERLKTHPFLWLQMLFAALLALALMRPACTDQSPNGQTLVLVLDASASMNATDGEPTRWESALQKARNLVENAPPDSPVALLQAGAETKILSPPTQNHAQIQNILQDLSSQSADPSPGQIDSALYLATNLGDANSPREVVLLSDGAFPQEKLPPLPHLRFVRVGQKDTNLAITSLKIQAGRNPQEYNARSTVSNTGSTALSATLTLRWKGQHLESHRLDLSPGAQKTFLIPLEGTQGKLEAHLSRIQNPEGAQDLLPQDNQAFAVLSPPEPTRVTMVGSNPLLLRALEVNPRLKVRLADPQTWSKHPADLYIFEDWFPPNDPEKPYLAFAPPKTSLVKYTGTPQTSPRVSSWEMRHPVLQNTDLPSLRFGTFQGVEPDPLLSPLASFEGEDNAFLFLRETPKSRGLLWIPDLLETDFPLRATFPVFLYNAARWLHEPDALNDPHNLTPGARVVLPRQSTLHSPQNQILPLETFQEKKDRSSPLLHQGFYTSRTPEGDTAVFALSLQNRTESSIAPKDKLAASPSGGTIQGQETLEYTSEWSWWVVLAALVLLLLEGVLWLSHARGQQRRRSA